MLKIGFYSPYLDTFGGGERYILTLASHWSTKCSVEIFWNDASIIKTVKERLDIDISNVRVVRNIFKDATLFQKLFLSRQYDLIYFLSDGSIPSSFAKHNILHFQVPFDRISYSHIKLSRYQAIVCNSNFTRAHIDERIRNRAIVIYPPVEAIAKAKIKKEKIILSVGRFSGFHTAKKQHVLIDAFSKGIKSGKFIGWKLVIAGGLLQSDHEYFNYLESLSKGIPVELYPNILHDRLLELYARASLYWHAAGFCETDARWMEHFGITTVEAMSAGGIPLVYDAGGQPEIVNNGKNGYLWRNVSELIEQTHAIIINTHLATLLQKNAINTSEKFSVVRFNRAYDDLLKKIRL